MPLDYLSELKESCAIAKSRSLTVTRATKITEWKSAFIMGLLVSYKFSCSHHFKFTFNLPLSKECPGRQEQRPVVGLHVSSHPPLWYPQSLSRFKFGVRQKVDGL